VVTLELADYTTLLSALENIYLDHHYINEGKKYDDILMVS
jgi:hypothetical protein